MPDPLSQLLASRDWLMADGATGTNLFNMGLQSNVAPELWNADQPGTTGGSALPGIHSYSLRYLPTNPVV